MVPVDSLNVDNPVGPDGIAAGADGQSSLDIHSLLHERGVETHFQPITSIRRQSVIGLEALSRGFTRGAMVPPLTLFKCAEQENLALDLDCLCRETAVQTFRPLFDANRNLILFLNFHALSVQDSEHGRCDILDLVQQLDLDPRNVVIEILENEFGDAEALRRSVETYKKHGFLVALDDIGAGHSNLDRIAFIKPDMLKLDRVLVQGLHQDYHKQEVFKSLVNLSEKIGGWVVAEGIEQEEDAIMALELGADMMQGFYFSRPHKVQESQIEYSQQRISDVAREFKHRALAKIQLKKSKHQERVTIINEILSEMFFADVKELDERLEAIIKKHTIVQSACVLDADGVQITDTITNLKLEQRQKQVIFGPPAKGTDHSLKEYFYLLLETDLNLYTTAPYVPLPSGQLCTTVSALFTCSQGQTLVLCVHMDASHLHSELVTQNYQH